MTKKKPADSRYQQQRQRQWRPRTSSDYEEKREDSSRSHTADRQSTESCSNDGDNTHVNRKTKNAKNECHGSVSHRDHPDSNERERFESKGPKRNKEKNTRNPASPSSFLASVGACMSVGKFRDEQNEEIRVEYRRCNLPNSCYRRQRARGQEDQKTEVGEVMVDFLNPSLSMPLSKSRTLETADTSKDSVLILNTSSNTNAKEKIHSTLSRTDMDRGSRRKQNSITEKAQSAFSSTRNLLFGTGKNTRTDGKNFDHNPNNGNHVCNKDDLGENHSTYKSSGKKDGASKTLYDPAYDDNGNTFDDKKQNDTITGGDVHNISNVTVPLPSILRNENNKGDFANTEIGYTTIASENDMGGHREIQYWRQRLNHSSQYNGKKHSSTADAFLNLGLAQLKLQGSSSNNNINNITDPSHLYQNSNHQNDAKKRHQYDLAVENLTIAHEIFEGLYGPHHLAVGRALDALGLAIVRRANHEKASNRTQEKGNSGHQPTSPRNHSNTTTAIEKELSYAQRLLEDALALRAHHLGVWHVDTVETYNKLAGVHLHLGQVQAAATAYHEVFLVRRAIFGANHPSVAISAHSLANCYYRLGDVPQSLKWYQTSLNVYETMGLPYRHPTVAKLLKDRSRLEQYMES
ncbi:unnamed protein product [Pseudo-nitzschia multistriata]|uniref:Kinesin light chain n=1 Tax=Pseudo-nitzschia multistriata TaxID=183589 RepID=A0A448ZL48_9STRA|nr:unnamed protein product [Pseudo-nitzschia multistriata]